MNIISVKGMIFMKKISTISEKRTSLSVYMVFIAAGIAIGAFLAKVPFCAGNSIINQYFLTPYEAVNPYYIIGRSFLFSAAIITAAFFFGASAVGQPFGISLLIYRGIGIGISTSSMYISMGSAAIIPVTVTVLPKAAAFSLITALSVRENVHNSCLIFSRCFGKGEQSPVKGGLKLWLIKYFVLIILSLIISSADGVIYFLFTSVSGN